MGIISIRKIGTSKRSQIISCIEKAVLEKTLKKGDKLPSINSIRNQFSVSRDTILNAYGELKTRGIVQSIVGKGYYLIKEEVDTSHKIFLLFDEFNAFKQDLYNGFVSCLPPGVEVDIFFHHFSYEVFRSTIVNNAGNYSYYVIMPANFQNTGLVVSCLPQEKVYILDQRQNDLKFFSGVYQDFERGIVECLEKLKHRFAHYSRLVLVFDPTKQPAALLKGVQSFCLKNDVSLQVLESNKNIHLQKGFAYMTLEDVSLLRIIKQMKSKEMDLIDDIGIVAYNDTLLKEVVIDGITVISTNFEEMGKKLAKMLLKNSKERTESSINLIKRKSI